MSKLTRAVALGSTPAGRVLARVYRAVSHFHLPIPFAAAKLIRSIYLLFRSGYYWVYRVFWCEPVFKGACRSYGRNLKTGVFTHWVAGDGDIIIGDDCRLDGKVTIVFASRFADQPTLRIGDRTGVGHMCQFVIADRITIGSDCHIAGGTRMLDSSGHPLDPTRRLANEPPDAADVKPISIGDNVWIGGYCTIFPGVQIGDNSVVATGSVVTGDVPPNTLVAGYPARMIKRLDPPRGATTVHYADLADRIDAESPALASTSI